jgi:hypothetical protein
MIAFIHGLNSMGFAVAGLFFLRFRRQTKDVFFTLFAVAFWLFAINYATEAWLQWNVQSAFAFVPRLAGFALIIIAILSKNVGTPVNSGG